MSALGFQSQALYLAEHDFIVRLRQCSKHAREGVNGFCVPVGGNAPNIQKALAFVANSEMVGHPPIVPALTSADLSRFKIALRAGFVKLIITELLRAREAPTQGYQR